MARAGQKAVLVIDDDPDYRELMRSILEGTGVAVFEAADCTEALSVLERERSRIGLILLDYYMPGLAPCPCAASLRQRGGEDLAIVLVTASSNAAQCAHELGLQRWLSKPFDFEQLGGLIRSVLA